ncbi:MAG: efflux RND transporter permease subunit [Methylocystis sp.]|nr:efflux RND transporter permease subunit [Methylocystis sp.]MCA3589833.1 efflux RND transporter permease subunit [Methylocystis sp.]MCA3592345.1 efflux RND transporter permease subunit [Methylocystis sp.]
MSSFNLSAWAVRHQSLTLFLMIALFVAGAMAYMRLGRAEDPSFTIKVAVITAAWPGATTQEMQDQVSDRIEKKLQELPSFDRVETYTKPGFVVLQLVFKDSTRSQLMPELFYQIRKKMNDLRPDLPAGLIGPNVNDEYGDVDNMLYMVTADGANFAQLKVIAEKLKSELLRVPNVVKVNLYGQQDERIFVEFSHAKLATLGVPAQAVFDSLARQNSVVPAGVVDTASQRVALRVTGALDGAKAVAETPVEAGGRTFRLGDIATITRGYEDPAKFLVRQDGRPALAVGVVMQKGANILTLGEAVNQVMERFEQAQPVGVDIIHMADQAKVVEKAVSEFLRSFAEALAIVLFVSFLSLGWRTGIVVAFSVPLVLAMVFVAMLVMGIDLHRISLGALIIALGLLVDDAIIALETMVVKMEQGWDRYKAAAAAWDTTAFPMLTGTLVTVAGFLPIGFANSGVGEYTGSIFWVVAIALVASWIVAVTFIPYLGVKLLPEMAKAHAAHDPHAIYETRGYNILRRIIRACVNNRFKVVTLTICVFGLAVIGFGRVQQQFFPLSERLELFFQMRLPEGTAIGVTTRTAQKAEQMLAGDPNITGFSTYIGQGSPRFWLGLNPQQPLESFAEIVIMTKDLKAREEVKARIEKAVAEGALAEARVRVDRFNFGPPVGFPVQFRIVGPDPMKLREFANEAREIARLNKNLIDPHFNWNEMTPSVRLVVDQERARALGLDPQSISQTLQTLISGVTVTTMRDGTEKVDVVARAVPGERLDLGRIGDLTVLSRGGVAVPLAQVARIEYGHEEPILWRRNRDMAITVRGDVADGVQPPTVTNEIWPRLQPLMDRMPAGYRIETGGAIEESAKGNASIAAVAPVMIIVMLTLIMIQVQSFAKLFLVFASAPLGVIGASLALNISGMPFGFVALLGLIALAGMDMRNSLILADQVMQDVKNGMPIKDAIVESVVRRSRPVMLTAMAAILAMVPLARSAFWGPMAVTIMGGLFVATFMTLLFLPALYAVWFRRQIKREQEEEAKRPAAQDNAPVTAGPLAVAAE